MNIREDEIQPDIDLPRDTVTLIGWLDQAYPRRCIARGETLESAHRYAGQRELVDQLVSWLDETLHPKKYAPPAQSAAPEAESLDVILADSPTVLAAPERTTVVV